MAIQKIVILGNSVSVRTRPHQPSESKNYGQRLQHLLNKAKPNELSMVRNLGFGRATINEVLSNEESIINHFGDIYILNIGVVDAASREIPLWWANLNTQSRSGVLRFVFANVYNFLVKPRRNLFTRLRGCRPWIGRKQFSSSFLELVTLIRKNTSGNIICIGILPANERVEQQLPGSGARYLDYNSVMQQYARSLDFVFVESDSFNSLQHYPDGTHLNDEGHAKLASMLADVILNATNGKYFSP